MARARNIKPSFFDNEDLGELTPLTRLLFIGLWCLADREGRLEDKPKRIKKMVLGYDAVSINGVDEMLSSLNNSGFIVRYSTDNDEQYIQIINFTKHQNPHIKEKPSIIPPAIADVQTSTRQAPDKHQTKTVQARLIPDSLNLIPDSLLLIPDSPYPLPAQAPDGCVGEKSKSSESLADAKAAGAGNSKPASPSKTLINDQFSAFWAAYPKKKSKGDAEKVWKAIKPNEALYQRIMRTLDTAKESKEWAREAGQFIPYPATWLRAKGWEDEFKEEAKDEKPKRNPDEISSYAKKYKSRDIYDV